MQDKERGAGACHRVACARWHMVTDIALKKMNQSNGILSLIQELPIYLCVL